MSEIVLLEVAVKLIEELFEGFSRRNEGFDFYLKSYFLC